MTELLGAGNYDANQPPELLTACDAQRIPPAATGLPPGDLLGAGDGPVLALHDLRPRRIQSHM